MLVPTYFDQEEDFVYPPGNIAATTWKRGALRVLRSIATMTDGSHWLHVSLSKPKEDPSWEQMVLVKQQFIGDDAYAIMVLPPRGNHVNLHHHCFQWWAWIDGPFNYPDLQNIKWESGV